MPLLDFLTSGSAAAVLAAGVAAGAAAAGAEAALAGAAAVDAAFAGAAADAAGVWAWATRPENASRAVISEVFNMVCFPIHGETAMHLQRHGGVGVDPFTRLYPPDTLLNALGCASLSNFLALRLY